MMKKSEWMSFAEVQRTLKRSRPTVYRLIDSGVLPVYYQPKAPRTPLFRRSDVEALDVPVPRAPVLTS